MSGRSSGVDAIAPAFERTKSQLFMPFRFGHWLRLAVVCLLTGEVTGGGGGWGGANRFNFPPPQGSPPGSDFLTLLDLPFKQSPDLLIWLLMGLVALILLVLVMIYVSSLYRFILFDAVLKNRCELGEGWRRWQPQGSSYFLWQVGFGLASLVALGAIVGGPILLAWRAGVFRSPDRHFGLLLIGGVVVFCLFLGALILSVLGSLFAKDFVVPVMALENRGVLEGWQRVLPMLGEEKGAYVVYVLMKIVLAIGSALLFGIIDFIVLIALLVPLGVLGVAIFFLAKGAGLAWNPVTIGVAVVAGSVAILLILFVISFVSSPAMIFFQSYALHFWGARYAPLGTLLATPPPPPPASPPAAAPAPIT